jgi:hypothetical protein
VNGATPSAPPGANLVSSVFGRTGAVVAAANDYSEAQLSFTDITTNNVSTSKHGFTPKLPNDATKYLDGTGAYTVPAGAGTDGWTSTAVSLTYSSVDGPTGVCTTGSDLSGTIPVGARLKFTQTTVKYFIVTAIDATTITFFGGTDYALVNAAVSAVSWSAAKVPFGFPATPAKWKLELLDTTLRNQTNPTANTVYNLGSLSLDIHIGVWNVLVQANGRVTRAAAGNLDFYVGLSTANNTFALANLIGYSLAGSQTNFQQVVSATDVLALTSKTTHYLNAMNTTGSGTNLSFNPAPGAATINTLVRATCAYL